MTSGYSYQCAFHSVPTLEILPLVHCTGSHCYFYTHTQRYWQVEQGRLFFATCTYKVKVEKREVSIFYTQRLLHVDAIISHITTETVCEDDFKIILYLVKNGLHITAHVIIINNYSTLYVQYWPT